MLRVVPLSPVLRRRFRIEPAEIVLPQIRRDVLQSKLFVVPAIKLRKILRIEIFELEIAPRDVVPPIIGGSSRKRPMSLVPFMEPKMVSTSAVPATVSTETVSRM